jgi:hypothetical protein
VRLIQGLLFGCLTAGALLITPTTAQADHWSKSSDGYWYYWSDSDRQWYYQDNSGKWFVQDTSGNWVPWSGYSSYYYEPDTYYYPNTNYYYSDGYDRGWYGGYGGIGAYWGRPYWSGSYDGGRGWGGGGRGWGGGGRGGRR